MSKSNSGEAYDTLISAMYDLTRDELRRLAWEALLISDGPNRIRGDADGPVEVKLFENRDESKWFAVSNPEEL